jgi:methylenetetrahydrofolate reductase (NADPH)
MRSQAIGNILALGGDRPTGMAYDKSRDSFQHAVDLVNFYSPLQPIRRPILTVAVSVLELLGFPRGHPATPNRLIEMDHLKAKVDAGADYVVTQLFFDIATFSISGNAAHLQAFRSRLSPASCRLPRSAGLQTHGLSSLAARAFLRNY